MPLTAEEAASKVAGIFNPPETPASPAVAETPPAEAESLPPPAESTATEETVQPEKTEAPAEQPSEEAQPAEGEISPSEESAMTEGLQEPGAPNEFFSRYKENGDLKAFLAKHGDLKADWFKAAQILSEFPVVEDAKEAKKASEEISELNRLYFGDGQAKRQFLAKLAESSKDPSTGRPSGHYEQLANAVMDDALAQIGQAAQSGQLRLPQGWNAEHMQAAVNGLRAVLGLAPIGGPREAQTNLGDQAANSELQGRLQEIQRREQTVQQERQQIFSSSVDARYGDWLGREVTGMVEKSTGLKAQPKGFQTYIRNTIVDQIKERLRNDSMFRNQLEQKIRSGNGDAAHAGEISSFLIERAKHYLPSVAREAFREAGAQIEQKQAAVDEKAAKVPKRKEILSSSAAKLQKPASGPGGKPKMAPGESVSAFSRRLIDSSFGGG